MFFKERKGALPAYIVTLIICTAMMFIMNNRRKKRRRCMVGDTVADRGDTRGSGNENMGLRCCDDNIHVHRIFL